MIVEGRDLRSYQIPLSIYKLVLCPGPSEDILDFFFFFTTLSDYFTTLSDYSFIHSSAFSGHLLSVYHSALCKSKNRRCKSHGPYPWEIRICLQSIWKESGNDYMCFLDNSVGKVSACNTGDPPFDSWVRKIH